MSSFLSFVAFGLSTGSGVDEASRFRPAARLYAWRWILDCRNEASGAGLVVLEFRAMLCQCQTIMNCGKMDPKPLNPAKGIAEIKKMTMDRVV